MLTRFSKLDSRIRPVVLAYATTGLSKIATVAVQIIALPIVAASVGLGRFGAMLTVAGVASFLSIAGQGLGPATSFSLATAQGAKNREAHRENFWASMTLASLGAILVTAIGLAAFFMLPADLLSSRETADFLPELYLTLLAATAHVALFYLGAFVEGARAATAQNHITNLFAFAASCLVFLVCLLAGQAGASLPIFYFIIFAIPPLVQCANLAAFMVEHRHNLGRPKLRRDRIAQTLRRLASYAFAQSGFVLHLQGIVIFSGTMLGLQAGAIVGAISRVFILVQSAMVSLTSPVLPLITKSDAANQPGDAQRILTAMMAVAIGGALTIGLAFALAGSQLLHAWLGIEVPALSPTTFAAGVLFIGYSSTHIGYLALLSLDSVGSLAAKYCLSGIIALGVDYLFFSEETVAYPLLVSAVALLAVNGTALALQLHTVRSRLRRRVEISHLNPAPL